MDKPVQSGSDQMQTTTRALLVLGGLLIVVGIITLISSSWASFTPAGRIITVTIPLALLYFLTWISFRRAPYRHLADYLLVIASIIFPFVLGVILYQSGVYTQVNSTLVLTCSLVSLILYSCIEFIGKQKGHAVLVLIAFLVSLFHFGDVLGLSPLGHAIAMLLASFLPLATGWTLQEQNSTWEAAFYHIVGAGLFFFGVMGIPLYYGYEPVYRGIMYTGYDSGTLTHQNYTHSLGFAGSGILIILLAIWFSRLWQQQKSAKVLLFIRRFLENIAPVIFVGPALLVSFGSGELAFSLIAFALSIILLAFSFFVRVPVMRPIGYVTAVITLIQILLYAFSELEAFWPILLLVGGFILIGFAFLILHWRSKKYLRWLWDNPEHSLFDLGAEPNPAPAKAAKTTQDTGWQWLLVVIVVLIILSLL